jgi:hypothetical protein
MFADGSGSNSFNAPVHVIEVFLVTFLGKIKYED